jgi:hypothetical protein
VIVTSADGALAARAPEGWTSGPRETMPAGVAAWLVSADGGAVIALREISLDRLAGQRVRKEGLSLLARLSLSFRTDSARSAENVSFAEYRLGENDVCSYEVVTGGGWNHVIVAVIGGRCYECEASSAHPGPEAVGRIVDAQEAFVANLTTSIRG